MVILMTGVAGAGKTTVGVALAAALGWRFVEGDAFHPPENVRRMHAGIALTDADRAPWLAALGARIEALLEEGASAVVACSALREAYRRALHADDARVRLVYLRITPVLAAARLAGRRGHFFPASLVSSQFEALEEPVGALVLDASRPVAMLVDEVLATLGLTSPPPSRPGGEAGG